MEKSKKLGVGLHCCVWFALPVIQLECTSVILVRAAAVNLYQDPSQVLLISHFSVRPAHLCLCSVHTPNFTSVKAKAEQDSSLNPPFLLTGVHITLIML